MAKWLTEAGPEADIVISSRIRVARNLEGYPFPHSLDENNAKTIVNNVYKAVVEGNETLKKDFQLINIRDLDKVHRLNYVEKHLISPHLAKNTHNGSFIINKEETISILLNEEDHIRIQCLLPGFQLENAWSLGDKVDDLIEEKIKYAFHQELGYLTTCPTNIGTGIRGSVMLHLPALNMTGYINSIFNASGKLGIAIRGIYGEGTEFLGNIFQVSNQTTLGISEDEIINNLKDVALQIIKKERLLRENLLKEKRIELEDKVFRSYGILKNARRISVNEAMKLISDVKLAIALDLIKETNLEDINSLMGKIQVGYLQVEYAGELSELERDIKRAEIIRKSI